jgi:hypothetical protein
MTKGGRGVPRHDPCRRGLPGAFFTSRSEKGMTPPPAACPFTLPPLRALARKNPVSFRRSGPFATLGPPARAGGGGLKSWRGFHRVGKPGSPRAPPTEPYLCCSHTALRMNRLLPRPMAGSRPRGIPIQFELDRGRGYRPQAVKGFPQRNEPPISKVCISKSPFNGGGSAQSPKPLTALVNSSPCRLP